MSIFKETFRDFVFNQLQLRQSILKHDGSEFESLPPTEEEEEETEFVNMSACSAYPDRFKGSAQGDFIQLGTLTYQGSTGVGNNQRNISKTVTLPAGAFYTQTVERQCTIRMQSGVDLERDHDLEADDDYEIWARFAGMNNSTGVAQSISDSQMLDQINLIDSGPSNGEDNSVSPGERVYNDQALAQFYVLESGVKVADTKGIHNPLEFGIENPLGAEFQVSRTNQYFEQTKSSPRIQSMYGNPLYRGNESDGYGTVPVPGITNTTIRTTTAYGSLRVAKVEFECHNRRQLEILE